MNDDYRREGESPDLNTLESFVSSQSEPMSAKEAIERVVHQALDKHLPLWRKKRFPHGMYDFQVLAVLPRVEDSFNRLKEDPSGSHLSALAYKILKEEGFIAVAGQWYFPEKQNY